MIYHQNIGWPGPGVIGSYFKNAVDNMNNPGSTYIIPELGNINIYVPEPAASMGCDAIQENFLNLQMQAQYWLTKAGGANILDKPNLLRVYSNQNGKMKRYQPFVTQCELQAEQEAEAGAEDPADPSLSPSSKWLPLGLAVGLGAVLYFKTRKKSRR